MKIYRVIRIRETIVYQTDSEEEAILQMKAFIEKDKRDLFRIEIGEV